MLCALLAASLIAVPAEAALSGKQRRALTPKAATWTAVGGGIQVDVRLRGAATAALGRGAFKWAATGVVVYRSNGKPWSALLAGVEGSHAARIGGGPGSHVVPDGTRRARFFLRGLRASQVRRVIAFSVEDVRDGRRRARPRAPTSREQEHFADHFWMLGLLHVIDPVQWIEDKDEEDYWHKFVHAKRTEYLDSLTPCERERVLLEWAENAVDHLRERIDYLEREGLRIALKREAPGLEYARKQAAEQLARWELACNPPAGATETPGGGGGTPDPAPGGGGSDPPASTEPAVDGTFGTLLLADASAGNGEFRSALPFGTGLLLLGDTALGAPESNRDVLTLLVDPAGDPDPAWDGDGRAIFPLAAGSGNDYVYTASPGPPGAIVFGGQAGTDAVAGSLTSTGTLDAVFSGDGFEPFDFGGGFDRATAIAVQADGKLLIGAEGAVGDGFLVRRFMPTGGPDTGFGTGGLVTIPIGASGADTVRGLAVDPSTGNITVAGTVDAVFSGSRIGLAGLDPDGDPLPGFGTGGTTVTPTSATDRVLGFTVDGDGRVYVGGTRFDGSFSTPRFFLARYTGGVLDTGFGGGVVVTQPGPYDFAIASSLAVQPDGKVLQAGGAYTANSGTAMDMALVRFTTSGALDTGFSEDGKALVPVGTANDYAGAMTLQSGGTKAVLAGGCADGGRTVPCAVRLDLPQ
jgi:uncharacterized delta-60 repeat protein